jgi:O-antigen/teichoic acid export membrane protein
MIAFFGRDYRVDGRLLAGLTLAAICLALLTLTGSAVLATSQHKAYAIGWFLSSLAAVAVLLTHIPLDIRSVLSLCVGPLVGIVIHLAAVRAASTADLDTGADEEP